MVGPPGLGPFRRTAVLATLVLGKASRPAWVCGATLAAIWARGIQVGCGTQGDPLSCDDHTDQSGGDAVGAEPVERPGQASTLTGWPMLAF